MSSHKYEKYNIKPAIIQKKVVLLQSQISRSGAVVARWAHNPKVVRSSRASATKNRLFLFRNSLFSFIFLLGY